MIHQEGIKTMTINAVYQALIGNFFFGGIAAAVLIFIYFRRASRIAATGDKAKMVTWAVAPGLMVLASVIITGAAIGVALPRLQAMFLSTPVQNALDMGNTLTSAADSLLSGDYSGSFEVPTQSANSEPVTFTTMSSNTETMVEEASVPQQLEMKPLAEMFTAAAVNVSADTAPNAATSAYVVQRGDSLFTIARRVYGDGNRYLELCKANGLTDCNNLKIGQTLIVPSSAMENLQKPIEMETNAKIAEKRDTSNQTIGYKPRQNQSYIPKSWNVLEQGQMSVGEPANMTPVTTEANMSTVFKPIN